MLNRRSFIRNVTGGAAALAGSSVFPPSVLGANDRVRFGLIGAGSWPAHLLGAPTPRPHSTPMTTPSAIAQLHLSAPSPLR